MAFGSGVMRLPVYFASPENGEPDKKIPRLDGKTGAFVSAMKKQVN